MKATVPFLILGVLAGCHTDRRTTSDDSAVAPEAALPQSPGKLATIRFAGSVKRIVPWSPAGSFDTFAVQDEVPRFVLFLHITSADPPNYWFQPGRNVDFLIHDPIRLFGGDQEEVIGKSYEFRMETRE